MTIRISAKRRSAGFSLIEIMVAIVILTIGIFAIIRLFPGGFLTILRTSELTQAQGLAQEQIDAEKQLPSVAESIVALDPTSNTGAILADIRSDDLRDESVQSASGNIGRYQDPYYVSNVNRFLHVIGETFRIPVPSSNSAMGQGAVYMLKQGPVYNQFSTDGMGNPTDSLTVRGAALQRTEQSSVASFNNPTATPLLVNDGQYAIDYVNHMIAFFPRVGTGMRQFVFAYEYLVTNAGAIQIVPVVPSAANPAATTITVPDVPAAANPPVPVWQDIFSNAGYVNGVTKPANFDPPMGLGQFHLNSDDVSRRFRYLTGPPAFSSDPYEYSWYSPQYATNANVGFLIFNPSGYSQLSAGPGGTQPITGRVDYTIFDNHIIHEDRAIPVSPPYDIRLSLQFVLVNGHVGDPGKIFDTQTIYNGIFRDTANQTPSVLVHNVNTGDILASFGGAAGQVAVTGFDDRAGILHLNQSEVESNNLQGATVRVFYRAEKDWGVQLQKANAHYTASDTPANVQYNSYYIGGSDPSNDGSPNRIYFPICEAGKTVVLGEFFVKTNQPAPNDRLRFSNEAFQVNGDAGQFESVGGRLMTWIDIGTQHPSAGTQMWVFDSQQTGRSVDNVRGGSLQVRVVWRDTQRWRQVDNITFLTQPSNP